MWKGRRVNEKEKEMKIGEDRGNKGEVGNVYEHKTFLGTRGET